MVPFLLVVKWCPGFEPFLEVGRKVTETIPAFTLKVWRQIRAIPKTAYNGAGY